MKRVFAPAAAATASDGNPPNQQQHWTAALRAAGASTTTNHNNVLTKNAAVRACALELGAVSARAATTAAARRALSQLRLSEAFDTNPALAVEPLRFAQDVREVQEAVLATAAAAVAASAANAETAAAAAAAPERLPSFWSSSGAGASAVTELASLGQGVLVALRASGVCVAFQSSGKSDAAAAAPSGGAAGRLFLNACPRDCVRSIFHARSAGVLVLVSVRMPSSSLSSSGGGAGLTCRAVAVEDVVAAVRGGGGEGGDGDAQAGEQQQQQEQQQPQATQLGDGFVPAAMDLSTWPGMGGSEDGGGGLDGSSDEEEDSEGGGDEDEGEDEGDDEEDDDDHPSPHHHHRKRRRSSPSDSSPRGQRHQEQPDSPARPPRAFVQRLVVASAPVVATTARTRPPTEARRPRVFRFLAGGGPALRFSCRSTELRHPGYLELHADHERALLFEPPPEQQQQRRAFARRRRNANATAEPRWGAAGRFRVFDLSRYPFRPLYSAAAFPGEDARLSGELLLSLRTEEVPAAPLPATAPPGGGSGAHAASVAFLSRRAASLFTTAPVAPWVAPFRDTSADGGRRLWGPGAAARRAPALAAAAAAAAAACDDGGLAAGGSGAQRRVIVVRARSAATGRLLSEHRLPVVAAGANTAAPSSSSYPPAAPLQVLELLSGECLLVKAPLSPLCFLDAVTLAVRAACFDDAATAAAVGAGGGGAAAAASAMGPSSALVSRGPPGPDPLSFFLAHPSRPLVVAIPPPNGGGGGGGARAWSTATGEPIGGGGDGGDGGGATRRQQQHDRPSADTCYLSGRLDALVALGRAAGGGPGGPGGGCSVAASCALTGRALGAVDPWLSAAAAAAGDDGHDQSRAVERKVLTGATAVLYGEAGGGGAVYVGNGSGLVGVWEPSGGQGGDGDGAW